jgi:hypothetical protein
MFLVTGHWLELLLSYRVNYSKVAFLVLFRLRNIGHGVSGEGNEVATFLLTVHVDRRRFCFFGLCFVEVVADSGSQQDSSNAASGYGSRRDCGGVL